MTRLFTPLFFLFLFSFAFNPVVARAENIVTLRTESEIESSSIMLSDVFSGIPDKLDRAIATAPAPGKSVTYDAHVLRRLATQNRLDWQPQSLADRAVLTRAATRITQDMIAAAIVQKLVSQNIKGSPEIQFDNRRLEVVLPADRAPDFELNGFSYDPVNKRFRTEIRAGSDSLAVSLPVTGRVSVKRRVPVPAHRLEAGTTVRTSDLEWQDVPEERLTADVLTDTANIDGLVLRQTVTEGQILRARDVAQPRLVARGSLVIMKIQTPSMLITAQGRALQDGVAGETVRITNTQSNRVVEGIVDGPGAVRVPTMHKLASAQ